MTMSLQMEAEKPVPEVKMKDVGPVEGGTAATQIVNEAHLLMHKRLLLHQ